MKNLNKKHKLYFREIKSLCYVTDAQAILMLYELDSRENTAVSYTHLDVYKRQP